MSWNADQFLKVKKETKLALKRKWKSVSSGKHMDNVEKETHSVSFMTLQRATKKFLVWKWSSLIAVRAISKPLHEGLKKIEENMKQDIRKSRLSIEDPELSDQAYTLLALLCKDEACAHVRSDEDGNGYQAWQALLRARTARNATGTNIHVARPKNQYHRGQKKAN